MVIETIKFHVSFYSSLLFFHSDFRLIRIYFHEFGEGTRLLSIPIYFFEGVNILFRIPTEYRPKLTHINVAGIVDEFMIILVY